MSSKKKERQFATIEEELAFYKKQSASLKGVITQQKEFIAGFENKKSLLYDKIEGLEKTSETYKESLARLKDDVVGFKKTITLQESQIHELTNHLLEARKEKESLHERSQTMIRDLEFEVEYLSRPWWKKIKDKLL